MRAPFMGGSFPFPVKYGYAMVGEVEAGPAALIGRKVFALHPHQTRFDMPAEAVVPVPADIPVSRAALAANVETALNATWDAAPGPSGRVAVIGAGVVGALVGFLCTRIEGTDVTLIDVDPARRELAKALGLKFAMPGEASGDCDFVFHSSASAEGLATALDVAGDEATVVELSWYGAGTVAVPLGGAFHSRRLKLISSQVGKVAPSHRPRWTHRRRLTAALALLDDPTLDVLLAPATAFDDLPARLPTIFSDSDARCPLIRYPEAH
jgi:threonine dehydrogenase-like Zn-dependent dehydrogenase